MTDGFEGSFTLNSAFTKEDWDKIADVEMEKTKSVTFSTPSGREVKYISVEVLQEIRQKTYKLHPVKRGDNEYANGAYDGMCRVIDIVCDTIDAKIKEITNETDN